MSLNEMDFFLISSLFLSNLVLWCPIYVHSETCKNVDVKGLIKLKKKSLFCSIECFYTLYVNEWFSFVAGVCKHPLGNKIESKKIVWIILDVCQVCILLILCVQLHSRTVTVPFAQSECECETEKMGEIEKTSTVNKSCKDFEHKSL